MSDHQDVSKQVKAYLFVFAALLVGTIVTVLLNSIHFDSMAVTITIAMIVAVIKAGLVAAVFMHLSHEKKMIYGILAFTVFFLIGLMFLTIFASHDFPLHTVTH